jgi:hypothetical protein
MNRRKPPAAIQPQAILDHPLAQGLP